MDAPQRIRTKNTTCDALDCNNTRHARSRFCREHATYTGEWGAWAITDRGYIGRYRNIGGVQKWEFQHRVVMQEMVGRALRKGENVHHRNGVKTDNRPENLELWVTNQPSGQRPEELVAWAREIIATYG